MAAALPYVIPALIQAAASVYSGYQQSESKYQQEKQAAESPYNKKKERLLSDLINSVNGQGSYSHLFNMDEDAFNKSYVEPAKARFQNQIAPQIQQSYIASGQQRNSGLNDQLLRAGVDMDQMLNEKYAALKEAADNRKLNALTGVINSQDPNPTVPKPDSFSDATAGYLSSPEFGKTMDNILSNFSKQQSTRKGFTAPNPIEKGALATQGLGGAR